MQDEHRRKLQIFIGATRRDLREARYQLIEAVLESGHIPSGMELWAAGVDPLLNDIAEHLRECDMHIIVLGARYGERIEGHDVSFTEWEYKQSQGKRPIMAFLLEESVFEEQRIKEIKRDPSEDEKQADLIRFRDELKARALCNFFRNDPKGIARLSRKCVNAIHGLINSRSLQDHIGWIRASSEEASTLRLIRENEFLERELARLREFSTLGHRVILDRVAKQRLAEVFWARMKGRIRRHGYSSLFFESGSTLDYVSYEFERAVLKRGKASKIWRVSTNNVLALIQLLLYADIDVKRFPTTAPDPKDKYGAIFPREWADLEEAPPEMPRSLHEDEARAVDRIRRELKKIGQRKTLFLATTSGWDLEHEFDSFHGPHVGSHPNMLFKRALYTSGHPVVIFLNAGKLGYPFETGKCFSIFDPSLPLEKALERFPIALCVGYDMNLTSEGGQAVEESIRMEFNNPARIDDVLKALRFTTYYGAEGSGGSGAVIAGNDLFKEFVPND